MAKIGASGELEVRIDFPPFRASFQAAGCKGRMPRRKEPALWRSLLSEDPADGVMLLFRHMALGHEVEAPVVERIPLVPHPGELAGHIEYSIPFSVPTVQGSLMAAPSTRSRLYRFYPLLLPHE